MPRLFVSLTLALTLSTIPLFGASRIRVLFLGDSITEGYGLNKEEAFPALVQDQLDKEGIPIEAVNAGISGSTSASALSRLRWHLRAKPDILVLALGANDGLRGLPVVAMKDNLAATIRTAQDHKIPVLLVGMKAPPNYGVAYGKGFEAAFADLAKTYKVAFVPFLLDRIAGESAMNLADGVHPNTEGQKVIAELITKALKPMLPGKAL